MSINRKLAFYALSSITGSADIPGAIAPAATTRVDGPNDARWGCGGIVKQDTPWGVSYPPMTRRGAGDVTGSESIDHRTGMVLRLPTSRWRSSITT